MFFQTFNCRRIDGIDYLVNDLSVVCTDKTHAYAEWQAGFMIVVFSLGLPVIYFSLMLVTGSNNNRDCVVGFLIRDYHPNFFYWEVVEVTRKLFLTGAMVLFEKGSCVQTVTAIGIIIVHMLVIVQLKPYKKAWHNYFTLAVSFLTLAIFLAGLLLTVRSVLPEGHDFRAGLSGSSIAFFLIAAFVAAGGLTAMCVADEARRAAFEPLVHFTAGGAPVDFGTTSSGRFHLFLSHVWSTGQDQVLSIKKELQLLVPSVKIWLDVENLQNVADLEANISSSDMTLMFLSGGYFSSWNCLREVRHATFVHCSGHSAAESTEQARLSFESTRQSEARGRANTHRGQLGIPLGGSRLILVRETDEQYHGGLPKTEILAQCPRKIGCADHVFKFVASCPECCDCQIDIQAEVRAHANRPGGVVDWIRFKDFKMISLKQIVQQMLVAAHPGGGGHELSIPGELSSTSWSLRTQPQTRVLLHSGCHLSDELPGLLQTVLPGIVVVFLDGGVGAVPQPLADAAGQAGGRTTQQQLVVVVHDKCFENDRVVSSLEFALTNKIPVVLLHEADADFQGCPFGSVIGQCPPKLSTIAGFGGAKIFDPIAVQWSRGAHQAVSIRLLAKSLGATMEQQRWCSISGVLACCRQPAGSLQGGDATEATPSPSVPAGALAAPLKSTSGRTINPMLGRTVATAAASGTSTRNLAADTARI
jgi:hypothetical protein